MNAAQHERGRMAALLYSIGSGELVADLETGARRAMKMLGDLRIDEPDARLRVQSFASQCQALHLQAMKLDRRLKLELMGGRDDES